ncbi:unnamed protein product [Mytilus coruscus]|uniref:Mutator-like transposase domain-containing protein n=1 Tax=Mytilus coruscus TaxID=42192 RepID=A0A6J8CCB5_MYTCO|nr:unnamed protein product [Mytilus coruscus]
MTFRSRNRGKFANKVSYFRSSFWKKRNTVKTDFSEHQYAKPDDDLDPISMFADIVLLILEQTYDTCKSVQIKEKDLSNGKLEASFDGGWQKRGTGWQYDSNTDIVERRRHASMIGLRTGKVMDYAYRSRSCKVCEVQEKRKETVPAHDCCRNWKGTSKGMEPDMAVEMTHKLNDSGCQIKVLHADNDSTTTSRLKVHFEDKTMLKKDSLKNCMSFPRSIRN